METYRKVLKRFTPRKISLPLTRKVTFQVQLQNQNRFQIPKIIHWEYKLEPSQALMITLNVFNMVLVKVS